MKVKFLSILAVCALFVACKNPFVTNILPDKNGKGTTYTVTFDKNGGTTEASPRTKTVTPPATTVGSLPIPPTRTGGYTFAGWNTAQNGNGTAFTSSTRVTKSITVYAKWTPGGTPASVKVDFENDSIGKTYQFTSGDSAPTVGVVADPVNNGQKSLQITSTGYNQAAIIPIRLPAALNTATSFTFRICLTNGTLSYKRVLVYIASSADTFVQYGFGNAANSGNPQFAVNKLGETDEIPALTLNQWNDYTIPIDSLDSAISGLTGDVFLAIGINHDTNEGITYLLDDLTFTFSGGQPPSDFPTLVDFEGDTIGATTKYTFTRGDNDPAVTVAADPVNTNQKSLRVVTNASGGNSAWNQAAVIPINLPDALSTYRSFRFRFNLQTAGTLLDNGQPRKINVYVADNTAAFIRYAFGNPSGNDNQFANLLVGEVEPDYGETNHWMDYAVNFDNPGSAINGLSGNVYVAIGINHNTGVTYYLDDLTFSKTAVIKEGGGALGGTLTVSNVTHKSAEITAGSVTAPTNGQTIEYSVSSTGSPGAWQTGRAFTGLAAETTYTAYARAAANAQYTAGPVKNSESFMTLSKSAGATLTSTITEVAAERRHNRIVVNAVTAPTNGQTVEYAISTGTTAPESGWQDGTAFTRLSPSTNYYVFARSKENEDNKAGAPITSGSPFTTTAYTPPPVPPSVVDFESDAVGKTYTRVSGQGTASAAVVVDPANAAERSLQISSNNWNNGAIIPINLPFALKNYESFTFRYRLATSMPENNRGSGLWVYVTNSPSSLTGNQLGNNHASYNPILLKNIVPDYGVTNQWVEHEIEIDGENLNNAIKELQGDIFLIIGINSAQSITYQLDDLTFNIVYNFVPPPSLSPATATFVKAVPADIPVTVNLYGNTLTAIKNGNTALQSPNDYEVNGNVVTLKAGYFTGMSDGATVTLTFVSSNGKSSDIVITIRAAALVTEYNFATDSPTISTVGTGISAAITGGLLTVTRTAGYGSATGVVIPFDFGTTNIGSYSRVDVKLRGSGDPTYKTMLVEYTTGTAANPGSNSTFGSVSTGTLGNSFVTLQATKSGSPSATGQVKIIISFGSTNPSVHEIESIKFVQ